MAKIIAIDLGGTNIRAAFFAAPHPPYERIVKIPTEADQGAEHIVDRIAEAVQEVMPDDTDDLRIGVGSPGPIDPKRGMVLNAANLKGFVNYPLKAHLQEKLEHPIRLGNDADMACLGEWGFGAGVGTRNMIYLTISTGIGGGIMINGQLVVGGAGLAGEIGHMTVDPEGAMCGCGHRGHLEALASGPSMARDATALIQAGEASSLASILTQRGKLTAIDLNHAAETGDELARRVIAKAGSYMGLHIANLAHALNPEAVILGGGVINMGDFFLDPLRQALKQHIMHENYLTTMDVKVASLGDDAGIIGAMVLASQQ